MAKTRDIKKADDRPAEKNIYLKKNVFDTTSDKIDRAIAAMQLKGEKLGISEFIDKAVDAFIQQNKLTISK